MSGSTVTIHMVSSADGFIASDDNNVSWMHSTDKYDKGKQLTEEEITDFLSTVDCYVMGSKTFEHAIALGWAYGDTQVVVLTKRNLDSERESVSFQSGVLAEVIAGLKRKYGNIWMVGGAELTKSFIQQDLADKIVLTLVPVILGKGLPFFDHIGQERKLHLEDAVAYNDGMVELTYQILKS